MNPIPLLIRDGLGEDSPYVFATWLKAQRTQGDRAEMRNSVYFENEKRRVGYLLSRSRVLMAVNPDDAAHLYGYVVFSRVSEITLVHFLFVKPAYRKLGVATALMRDVCPRLGKEELVITAVSPEAVRMKRKWQLVFNPHLVTLLEQPV